MLTSTLPVPPTTRRAAFRPWLPLALCLLLAAALRLRLHLVGDFLLVGSDGPYYPLQVRAILEHGRLAFPDMPLLFGAEALLARLLQLLTAAPPDQCVVRAIQLVDVLVPPLAGVPVLRLARLLRPAGPVRGLPLLVAAYAVLNLTTIVSFGTGLHKNAVGLVGVFWFVYLLTKWLLHRRHADAAWTALALGLCALTHFGSFALLLPWLALLGLVAGLSRQVLSGGRLAAGAALAAGLLAAVAGADPQRLTRLVQLPGKLFAAPVLLFVWEGHPLPLWPPLLLSTLVANGLVLLGLALLLRRWHSTPPVLRQLGVSLGLWGLLLASPLLGLEWASRLYMMSFVPVVGLYLVLASCYPLPRLRGPLALVFAGLTGGAVLFGLFLPPSVSISPAAYQELRQLPRYLPLRPTDVLTGRQDLRLLVSWLHRPASAADYALTPADTARYRAVYVLRQLRGSNLPPARFREPAVPPHAVRAYRGPGFEVYRLTARSWPAWRRGRPLRRVRGQLARVDGAALLLRPETGRPLAVRVLRTAEQQFRSAKPGWRPGMWVEAWGDSRPFSLGLDARAIHEVAPPEAQHGRE